MEKRHALLSVFDKTGIVEFATGLVSFGFVLIASGGTAAVLREAGLEVIDTADLVGGPILGHRVVTLSREIHAGILAKDNEEDRAELARLGINFIDLVGVDLYPLEGMVEKEGVTEAEVIEMTDVGGPTMLHAAAKGRRIVVTPQDYDEVLDWLGQDEPDPVEFRRNLAFVAELTALEHLEASAAYIAKVAGIEFVDDEED